MSKHLTTVLTALLVASYANADSSVTLQASDSRAPVSAEKYMVSAANPYAAMAGTKVLAAGGTAADAAVTVQTMLNLFEPQSSGIGGGAFMLYWDASEKKLLTYDGREKAPASATPEYFYGADGKPVKWWDAVIGGRSVGVPGTLKLLEKAHESHGKLDWADLLLPAIVNAEAGFEISPRLARFNCVCAKEKARPVRAHQKILFQ